VDVDVGEGLAKLDYGEAHIAVRAGARPEHPDYVVTHFCDIGFNLYAHASYLARNGMPEDTTDFTGHTFLLPQFQQERLPFGAWFNEHVRPEMVALSSRDIGVMGEAVCAGVGLGVLGDAEARARGNLHPVLPANPAWSVVGWLVTHVDLHRTEKVQAMLKCIKDNGPA
jgi:DNA-binding transcriptional LysR family regulator